MLNAAQGVGTGKKCPRNRELVYLAQDRANLQPTDTIWGPKLVKKRQKGNPNVARVDSAHGHKEWTPPAPVSEPSGPFEVILGHFGPCWAHPIRARGGPSRAGDGHSGAQRFPIPTEPRTRYLRNPNGEFRLWGHSGPASDGVELAACCLLLGRRAGSTHCPNK